MILQMKGVVRSNILKLEDRLKNTKAIKFAIYDHSVKNLNCIPNPVSTKNIRSRKEKHI